MRLPKTRTEIAHGTDAEPKNGDRAMAVNLNRYNGPIADDNKPQSLDFGCL